MSRNSAGFNHPFGTLRRFIRERAPAERCEMCSAQLAADHQHLIGPSNRRLMCACGACAVLFGSQGETKYRRIPRRIRFLPDFNMTDSQWESLMVPINMAFFFDSASAGRVIALYPSPAGPTESLLTLDSWDEIVRSNPILKKMESDVEALLVNRGGRSQGPVVPEYYLVPIDECYKLVGLIRSHWRGFSGGSRVWEEITSYFAKLKERSDGEASHD